MSVFRIRCKKIENNYKNLWEAKKITWSTGTAFKVSMGNNLILITAYHVIENAVSIDVIPDGSRESCSGKCVAYCYDVDLAVIEIERTGKAISQESKSYSLSYSECNYENNYNGILKNELSQGHHISVLGFPDNEINSSMTTGTISRICFKKVNNSLPQVLVQVDTTSNMGNSGGPVFDESQSICGMILGGMVGYENRKVSYILPIFTIQRYLKEFSTKYIKEIKNLPECCDLGIATKPKQVYISREIIECPVITSVGHGGPAHKKLFKGDAIISISNYPVRQYDLLPNGFPYWQLVREKHPRDVITLEVKRDDEVISVLICLDGNAKPLLPVKKDSIDTHYYIFAGMDFMPLNVRYFYPIDDVYNSKSADILNIYHKYKSKFAHGNTQVVLLKSIFPSELTSNQHKGNDLILTHINGKRIRSLKDVFNICEDASDNNNIGIIKFTFTFPDFLIEESIEINHHIALQESENIARKFIDKGYHNYNNIY